MLHALAYLGYVLGAGLLGAVTLVAVLSAYTALRYRRPVTAMWDIRQLAVLSFVVGCVIGLTDPLWRVPVTIIGFMVFGWLIRLARRIEDSSRS